MNYQMSYNMFEMWRDVKCFQISCAREADGKRFFNQKKKKNGCTIEKTLGKHQVSYIFLDA